MRRAAIEEQNRDLLARQRDFRIAADVVCDAWASFAEVQAVAVVGSVAKTLWKAVPRFREFRRQGIEVWHECADLDLALWLDLQQRLGDLRRSAEKALRAAFEAGVGISVVGRQLDVFLIEPASDRYLGRLCQFSACPKGKRECRVPGCGATPFNRRFANFTPGLRGYGDSALNHNTTTQLGRLYSPPPERTSPSSSCRAHFSKPLRLSRIACGDRRAAARLKGASLTAAVVWKFRNQELDGEAHSAR